MGDCLQPLADLTQLVGEVEYAQEQDLIGDLNSFCDGHLDPGQALAKQCHDLGLYKTCGGKCIQLSMASPMWHALAVPVGSTTSGFFLQCGTGQSA